jgi:hypothetical protein
MLENETDRLQTVRNTTILREGAQQMKISAMIFAAFVALSLIGCSSVNITTDYDKTVDFKALKTYDWLAASTNALSANQQTAMFQTGLVNKHIKNAVNGELEARGMTQTSANPEMLVNSYLGTEQKVNVTNYGYGYGARWGGYGGGVDVQQYTQGTLIVDFIDAKSKELIWRGVASGALSSNPDPNEAEQKIKSIIQQMLAEYPPAKAN